MKTLDQYFTGDSLENDFETLCDPLLEPERDRNFVNATVLSFVVKYLATYCEVDLSQTIQGIRNSILYVVHMAVMTARNNAALSRDGIEVGIASDHFSLKCLADIRQTSAIGKEILFNDRFERRDDFYGLELGSGTGILTAFMGMAAKRRRIRDIHCVGIELQQRAAMRSRAALGKIFGLGEALVQCADALSPVPYQDSFRNSLGLPRSQAPDFWISETISTSTPSMSLSKENFGLSEPEIIQREFAEKGGDPFVEVLGKTVREFPDFGERVRREKAAMFPDIFTGDYVPNKVRSTLRLRTGRNRNERLGMVGEEFARFEDLGFDRYRWDSGDYGQSDFSFLSDGSNLQRR